MSVSCHCLHGKSHGDDNPCNRFHGTEYAIEDSNSNLFGRYSTLICPLHMAILLLMSPHENALHKSEKEVPLSHVKDLAKNLRILKNL